MSGGHEGFDVVVVGAGSAGTVVATRLARSGAHVLLLEAGPDRRPAEIPDAWALPNPVLALGDFRLAAPFIWPDLTTSRTTSQTRSLYLRGRGVGGSSAINAQIAIRPPMTDFEEWSADGCVGWGPEEVLPYFAALEDDEEFGDEGYHGRNGPTPIHRTPRSLWGAVDVALAASARRIGVPFAADVNAPGASGVSPYPINARDGRRVSVNDAYLEPARDLRRLTVWGDALVDQVVFDGDRAIGVRIVRDGRAVTVYGDTIVLSAGVIHSPAVLLRSGIGPHEQLRSLGIAVRRDLPVGLGMQDHPTITVSFPLAAEARLPDPAGRHTNVCVRTTSGPGAPELDLLFTSLNQDVLAMATTGNGAHSGAFGVWLNRNYSRGEVRLASAEPNVSPVVDQRMLSDERDLPRMRTGVRTLIDLARSNDTRAITEIDPGDANMALLAALDDDRALDDYVLAHAMDAQHGTSTCRMGDPDDPATVIDPECRVLGTSGLRVVDASIFPSVPRANTNLATIMAGEKMAARLGE